MAKEHMAREQFPMSDTDSDKLDAITEELGETEDLDEEIEDTNEQVEDEEFGQEDVLDEGDEADDQETDDEDKDADKDEADDEDEDTDADEDEDDASPDDVIDEILDTQPKPKSDIPPSRFAYQRRKQQVQRRDQRIRDLELENARLQGRLSAGQGDGSLQQNISPLEKWESDYEKETGEKPGDDVAPPASVVRKELDYRDQQRQAKRNQANTQVLESRIVSGAAQLSSKHLGEGLGFDEITEAAQAYITPGSKVMMQEVFDDMLQGRIDDATGAKRIYGLCVTLIRNSGTEDAGILQAAIDHRRKGRTGKTDVNKGGAPRGKPPKPKKRPITAEPQYTGKERIASHGAARGLVDHFATKGMFRV